MCSYFSDEIVQNRLNRLSLQQLVAFTSVVSGLCYFVFSRIIESSGEK